MSKLDNLSGRGPVKAMRLLSAEKSKPKSPRSRPDQTKRMAEIVRLTDAIKRTDAAMERAQDTIGRLHDKRIAQGAELRLQNILLKWYLP